MALNSAEDLRTLYREASGGAVAKVINQLDEHCIEFLAMSPFMVLSTANADGTVDGSPKGGAPGFAKVVADGRVCWADSAGNNRLDSFENLVTNNHVALLFMIPGLNETLRINGTAELVTDPELCEQFKLGDKPAKVVVAVSADEAYIHCAKAFRRADLWQTESWPKAEELPSVAEILLDHAAFDADKDAFNQRYQTDVETTLWEPGGNK